MKMTLKALRVNKGLTQDDVAKTLKVSKTTVVNWERGKSLKASDLVRLSELYECTIDNIFF